LASTSPQSNQLISLSWQYALLLPCCVRPTSSPATSIGIPRDSMSRVAKFFVCRARSARTAGSSVGPSAPQFQLMLSSLPSRLSSPLARLCFSSYETRSASVKPSWQVTKLTVFVGRCPRDWYMSALPASRAATAPASPGSPLTKRRMVSR
jgi:hypothetical protein